ncbi:MAG: 7-cyano-7-deazaguanine synthase [bacterium]|nr:7-cyano-7-deazaguanine synthase [bacterium]
MSKTRRSLILLSGGLDSMLNLAEAVEEGSAVAALFIDYGQAAAAREEKAAREQAGVYGVGIEKVSLPWYRNLLPPTLRGEIEPLSEGDEAVWAPNRNGLLVAIAAAFADARDFDDVITGFNAEEAATFPDNSIRFIEIYNELLKLSVKKGVQLTSYTAAMNKKAIVKRAIELNTPLRSVYSCYTAGPKMCGVCNSCLRLKNALVGNAVSDEYRDLFGSSK